jgi:hypothetical protein
MREKCGDNSNKYRLIYADSAWPLAGELLDKSMI